jgi:2-C-methyl-D-erythritol 4-phosphate cytidylyltransferase
MSKPRFWAIIPAAGVGRRMKADVPKQYLNLLGRPVILHTLERLAAVPLINGIVVVIGQDDAYWPELNIQVDKPVQVVIGGEQRVYSVFNGVESIASELNHNDWILVHDAARPCVRNADIATLMDTVSEHACGGILATPVRDTMKLANKDQSIATTLDRSTLWHALTPQMFRASLLFDALRAGLEYPDKMTDEASALELLGYTPLLVEGGSENIKITRPEDLALAEFILTNERNTSGS